MSYTSSGVKSTVELIDLSDDTEVASGGGINNQDLTPPVGFLYRILSINLMTPAIAAATGSHNTQLHFVGCGTIGTAWHSESGANGAAYHYTPEEFAGDHPEAMLLCSNAVPFRFVYYNGSDTNQTGTREIFVVVEKILSG